MLRAIAIRESWMGADNPDLLEDLCLLSRWFLGQQKFEDCVRTAERASELSSAAFGATSKRNLDALLPLSCALISLKKFQLAEEPARRALSIAQRRLAASDRRTREAEQYLVAIFDEQGKTSEANALHQKILSSLKLAAGDELPFATYLAARAEHCQACHQNSQAAYLFRQAILHLGERAVLTKIVWLFELAKCLLETKDFHGAEQACRSRLSVIDSVAAGKGTEAGKTLLLLGEILEKQDRYPEAYSCYDHSARIFASLSDRNREVEALLDCREIAGRLGWSASRMETEQRLAVLKASGKPR